MLKQSRSLPVLPSIVPVSDSAHWVMLHPENIPLAITEWGHVLELRGGWQHPCHFFDGTEETVRWIFVLDVLNHCFWPDAGAPVWTVTYGGQGYSGYWGLAASLHRAMNTGFLITNSHYLAEIPAEDLKLIFKGIGEIPMFQERLSNLREAGRVLLSRWGGDVVNVLTESEGSAVRAIDLIVSSFMSFKDEALYHGHEVYFWKRAQIFIYDLYLAFGGSRWGAFRDISHLTAFADYKLPQVLRALGILSYHPALAEKVDSQKNLESGSEEEIEIRAMTIRAVGALKEGFRNEGILVVSPQVDNWLWQLGQQMPFRKKPYHRCRTIYY